MRENHTYDTNTEDVQESVKTEKLIVQLSLLNKL